MIRILNTGLAALLAIFVVCISPAISESRSGWIIHQAPYGFEQMVGKLSAAIKAEKMGRVTRASASAGAKGRGLTIPGNMIVGVYRNDFAVRMLEASLDSGIEAPVQILSVRE